MQKLCKSGYCLDLTDVTTRKQEKCSKFLCYSLHNGKVGSQHWPLNIWKIKLRKRLINWGKLSYSIAQIFTDFKLIVFWGRYWLKKVSPNSRIIANLCIVLDFPQVTQGKNWIQVSTPVQYIFTWKVWYSSVTYTIYYLINLYCTYTYTGAVLSPFFRQCKMPHWKHYLCAHHFYTSSLCIAGNICKIIDSSALILFCFQFPFLRAENTSCNC